MNGAAPEIDFAAVRRHVRGVVEAIAPHDSVERFEGLGVDVIRAEARFVGPREIGAGNRMIRARRVVIATGSEPAIPPIPGIDTVPYFTNETIFDKTSCPTISSLSELARSGSSWGRPIAGSAPPSRLSRPARAMPRDDPELAGMLLRWLAAEGVDIREQADDRIGRGEPRPAIALDIEDKRPASSASKDRIC